jgi:hypothetical protein
VRTRVENGRSADVAEAVLRPYENDADLAAIRDDARFQALLARL